MKKESDLTNVLAKALKKVEGRIEIQKSRQLPILESYVRSYGEEELCRPGNPDVARMLRVTNILKDEKKYLLNLMERIV
jgi:hypothetical protein